MLSKGMLRRDTVAEEEGLSLDFSFLQDPAKPVPSAGAQASADREALVGGTSLDRDGYYVSIARQAAGSRTPVAGEQLTILVIEDEALLQKLLQRLLESAGYAVRVAADRAGIVA